MRSAAAVSPEVNQFKRIENPEPPARREFLKASLGSLLLPALSTPWLAASYGTMASYISEGIGLSSIVQTEIRDKLLT